MVKGVFAVALLALFFAPSGFVFANLTPEQRAELERQLRAIEQEIAQTQQLLNDKSRERTSLERDIAILDAQIRQARLQIQARDIAIRRLTTDIVGKETTVGELNDKLDREKSSLAQIIRKTNKIGDYSLVELVLSQRTLSDFLGDLDSFASVKVALAASFQEIDRTRGIIQQDRDVLVGRREQEQQLRAQQEADRRYIEQQEREKQRILTQTRGEETAYQQMLQSQQRTAAEIRAALFPLVQATAIPFGDALAYAEQASAKTGVRPALILAILKQESNLGANVGTCNRPQDPAERKYDRIMPGPVHFANYTANGNSCGSGARSPCSWRDDQTALKQITARLGLDYQTVPLSCPVAAGGWGGAMGPSQFIPTTWLMYEARLSQTLGIATPNPWNPQHAIMATALLMADNGAANATAAAERHAACRYYSGSACTAGRAIPNIPYGNSVMSLAEAIQRDIDTIYGR